MDFPSVTQIIGFCNSRAFDNIPMAIMEIAGARGTEAHAAFSASLLNIWHESDDFEITGYLRSFIDWKVQFVAEVLAVEPELISAKYRFMGHPDAIVRLSGDAPGIYTLPDWKTPLALSKSWRMQLAGYRILAQENGFKIARVASLQPRKDGSTAKFQGYTRTLAQDANAFLSALNVWHFFNRE